MKQRHLILIIFFLIFSCGTLKDAGKVLRNEKTNSTDEFLIKKKEPLILPPDYNKIPEPGELSTKEMDEEEKLKKILKAPNNNRKSNNQKSSSVEETIIEKIRK